MTGTHDRLSAPGVSEFFEVIVQIETMVLNACPALMRPTPLRSPAVLALAESLAKAVRAATRDESCECGPNTMCVPHAMGQEKTP